MFSWIPIYKEIAEKLLSYENRQSELIKIINDLREEGLKSMDLYDADEDNKKIPLEEFDPFTFFSNFNRGITLENMEKIVARLKKLWNLKEPIPTDFNGLPEVDNRNAWFFNWKKDRDPKDIPLLWQLFKEVMTDNIKAETFDSVLKIGRIGKSKLTAGLSWVRPEKYLNISGPMEKYLKKHGINPEFADYQSYVNILEQAKKSIGKKFFEITHEAWEERDDHEEKIDLREGEMKESNAQKNLTEELKTLPLNLILYGPPGTGKTYEIQKKYIPMFTEERKKKSKEEYITEVAESLRWVDAIIVAMMLVDDKKMKVLKIRESEVVQAKARIMTSKDLQATMWRTLQTHTKPDCKNVNVSARFEPGVFWKNEDSTWEVDKEIVKEELPEIYEYVEKIKNFKPTVEEKEERYEFVTFHQSFSYEDFVEGIKPVVDEISEQAENKISYTIEPGIFKEMARKAEDYPERQYAIFIDEINRGNAASIFGELITLIEEDKRGGKGGGISVKLPYSKEKFTVPSNLYIIATMNTADRNIEALDTAFRRRFEFEEFSPKPELLSKDEHRAEGIDLEKMLRAINSRINILLDKDHLIGHSYFMGIKDKNHPLKELRQIFSKNIIPLLEEYFYSDRAKIKMVLGDKFVDEKEEGDTALLHIKNTENEISYEKNFTYEVTIPENLEDFKSIYEEKN